MVHHTQPRAFFGFWDAQGNPIYPWRPGVLHPTIPEARYQPVVVRSKYTPQSVIDSQWTTLAF